MCLLIVSAEGKFPSSEILTLGAEQNSDGAGIAWQEKSSKGNIVKWRKGLELEEIKAFKDQVEGKPHIIHFRLSTIGGKQEGLCHPFAIDEKATHHAEGESEIVLAHNGNWSGFSRELLISLNDEIKLPAGPWSDTRAMAWLAHLRGIDFLNTLNEKIAVLDKSGSIRIFNKTSFYEHEGLLLSYDPFCRVTKSGRTSSMISSGKYNDWAYESSRASNNIGSNFKTGSVCGTGLNNYTGFKKYTVYQLPEPLDA